MLYIYDIVVNFMDGDEIYESFEWEYKDILEHIKKMPVVKVDNNTFTDFMFNEVIVNHEFLETIRGKSSTYKEKLDFACLVTNDEKCFAIEFNEDGKVLFKSSLLLDEEEDIICCSRKISITNIEYKVIQKNPIKIRKLTRKEERDLYILKREIDTAYSYKDYEKLIYLYNEAYSEDDLSVHDKYKRLLHDLVDENFSKLKKLVRIISLINKK
ncbi:MAG: hypothetical protein HFJ38_02750 [Bacilli bacterium]|nr:hypothetical protein [Bacilli bacterium]